MAVNGIVILIAISSITFTEGVAISSVTVTKKEGLPSLSKSLSKISLPQVPVPEFPKFVSRPAKNPSQSTPSGSNAQNSNGNQQHLVPSQSQQQIQQQQPISHQSHSQNQQVHNIVPSIPILSPTAILQEQDEDEFSDDLREEMIIAAVEHEFHDGFTPSENFSGSLSTHHQSGQEKLQESIQQPVLHLPSLPTPALMESANHPMPPIISITGGPSTNTGKLDTGKSGNHSNGEKLQDSTGGDFPMPLHVLAILNALGSGGSLAQASKPEKDSAGQGFTTANAIGYATGDNATVTASVSNKMEVNTQTVILTESATASASSLSNGTAFSQATLSSNGWANQLGNGNQWPAGPGSGWAKTGSPIKKGRKLRSQHGPLFLM